MNVSKLLKLKTGTWDLSELVKNHKDDEFSNFLLSIDDKVKQFENKRSIFKTRHIHKKFFRINKGFGNYF